MLDALEPSSGGSSGIGAAASRSTVSISRATRALRWRALMPATSERWSSSRRRLTHSSAQRHTSQWSTGSGYVSAGGYVGGPTSVPRTAPLETKLRGAVVRHVVVDPQGCGLVRAAAEHDAHLPRPDPLDALKLIDVRADLEHGTGLHVTRQLRVGHLVVVRAPDRWALRRRDAHQEVGVSEPAAVEEGGLEDDVDSRGHRVDRLGRLATQSIATLFVVVALDRRHTQPRRREARRGSAPRAGIRAHG